MEEKIFDYKTLKYFSTSAVFMGAGLLIFGFTLLFTPYFYIGIISLVLIILIFTTHYGLEINVTNKTYRHYIWVLGIRKGTIQSYNLIEYIFIQSATMSYSMNSRVTSQTFTNLVFNGYLKFTDDVKIHMMQVENKVDIIEKLRGMAADLKTEIIDFTETEPIAINP